MKEIPICVVSAWRLKKAQIWGSEPWGFSVATLRLPFFALTETIPRSPSHRRWAVELERSALLLPDEGGSQSLEASRFLAASRWCRRTVVKPVFLSLTRWALTHRLLLLSLVSFQTLSVRAHPRLTGRQSFMCWVAVGFPWEQVWWKELGKEVQPQSWLCCLLLITSSGDSQMQRGWGWDTEPERLSSPPPWFKGKESTAQRSDVL